MKNTSRHKDISHNYAPMINVTNMNNKMAEKIRTICLSKSKDKSRRRVRMLLATRHHLYR